MLKDITVLSKKVFNEFIDKDVKISNPIELHEAYKSLHSVIESIDLVVNHYLALTLEEEFLQNSSFGEPVDKWRYFLNEDLEVLNKSIKKYLFSLSSLMIEDEDSPFERFCIMKNYFNDKSFYGFVRDDYSCGYVDSSAELKSVLLNTKFGNKTNHIDDYNKIDLSTYENRKDLKEQILSKSSKLKKQKEKLEKYIKEKYTIENLLYTEKFIIRG